ncbi:MAG: hypothetical protein RLY86_3764 [Pseudomonadota bacterium]|jgi:hypothetical protein
MAASSIPPERDVAAWLTVVANDLRAIRNNLFGPEPTPVIAAYHCQQAAEKLVKAVLVGEGIAFPKSHDIGLLLDLVPPGNTLRPRLLPFERFTPLSWIYRYPSASPMDSLIDLPDVAEVTGWLRDLEAAEGVVRAALLSGVD